MNPDQTAQSDLGPYCLQYRLPRNISKREEPTTKVVTSGLMVNMLGKRYWQHFVLFVCLI